MSSSLRIVLVAVVAAVLLVAGWSWWTSDERQIVRRLGRLMDDVDKASGENPLTAALAAQSVVNHFAQPFHFRARQFDFATDNRQSLIRAVALYRDRSERIATQVLDREVDVHAGRASMLVTARFQGGWQAIGDDAYRFRLDWVKQEGEWRIADADLLEVVAPLGGGP